MPLKRVPKSHDMSPEIAQAAAEEAERQRINALISTIQTMMQTRGASFFSQDQCVRDITQLVMNFVAGENRARTPSSSAADAAADSESSSSPKRR